MKRSLGLTLVGVLVILLSALFLAVEIFATIAIRTLPAKDFPSGSVSTQLDPKTFVLIGFAFVLVLCSFGIVNGIGVIRRWNWCRYVTMVFGFIAAAFLLMSAVAILFVPVPPTPGVSADFMRMGIVGFYLFWVALFLFISFFLLRRRIAEEFRSRQTAPTEPKPLAVFIVAGLLTVGLLAFPMLFVMKIPMFFLGVSLSPTMGRVVFSVWALASGAIGLALFRRVHSAYWFAVSIYMVGLLNGIVTLLPGPSARFAALMQRYSFPPTAQVSPAFLRLSIIFGLLSAIVPLILLAVGHRRFAEWCHAKTMPVTGAS